MVSVPREARVVPWSRGQGWPLGVLGGQRLFLGYKWPEMDMALKIWDLV